MAWRMQAAPPANVATMRSPSALLLLGLTAPAQSLHNGLVCTHRSHHRCVL